MQTNSFLAQSGAQEDVLLPIKIKFAFRRREGEPWLPVLQSNDRVEDGEWLEVGPTQERGRGEGGGNSERRLDWRVRCDNCCSCSSVSRQSGKLGSGRGGEEVGRARSTAGRPSGSGGREREIRLKSESEGGLTTDRFRSDYSLKGTRHCQENGAWGPRAGTGGAWGVRQLHLDWGRVGVAWGKALHFTFSSTPGVGAGMPADWRPQPWRETRSPALARCLSDGSRGGGGPEWLASCAARAKTHNGHLAVAQPPPQPKTRRSGSWSSGSAARPAPRARAASSRAPSPSRAPFRSRAPRPRGLAGAAPRGGRRRRPRRGGGRSAVTASLPRLGRQGWGANLVRQLAAPGEEDAGDPLSARSRQPGPALSCFSFALVSPPTARGSGEGCGRGRRARAAPRLPRTPRPRAYPSRNRPHRHRSQRLRAVWASECPCRSQSPHRRRLPGRWALTCNFSLPIAGSCGFRAAGSLDKTLVSCVLERLISTAKWFLIAVGVFLSSQFHFSAPKIAYLVDLHCKGALTSLRSR